MKRIKQLLIGMIKIIKIIKYIILINAYVIILDLNYVQLNVVKDVAKHYIAIDMV
jgi:hypothetical protein